MEYNKLIINNKSVHVINTDRFKTVSISFFLYKNFDKNDIEYLNFLSKVLLYNTKKYNTKRKFNIKSEELYNIEVVSRVMTISNIEYLVFTLNFINPMLTEKEMYKESIKFFNEILFNPNVSENGFNENSFTYNKKQMLSNIKISKEKPSMYAYDKYKEIMFAPYPAGNSYLGKEEKYESITSVSLYNFYKSLFNKFNLSVVALGKIDSKSIKNDLENIVNKFSSKNVEVKFDLKKKDIKTVTKKDKMNVTQSQLFIGYELSDLNYFETKYVLQLYNAILGSMANSVLFNNVREKYSLCYSIKSMFTSYLPAITVVCAISKNNYAKAIDAINDAFNEMKNEKELKLLLESAKKAVNIYINNIYDDPFALSSFYVEKELTKIDDIENRRALYESVTVDDIINLNKKIKRKVVYFLEGTL